jgi:L-aminopeptidase/D-esterase-like protein
MPRSASVLAAMMLVVASTSGAQPAQSTAAGAPAPPAVPRTQFPDRAHLEIDFPAIRIGVAEYDEGPTGTTVFHFPHGVAAAVDVRGGAAGTIGTDFLRLGYQTRFVDAVVFSGGSSYGLSAATGAAQAIREMRGGTGDWGRIATVVGAIIFDFAPRRFNMVAPDEALGAAALRAAKPGRFPLGAAGAGRFAMQSGFYDARGIADARQHSGQGAAIRESGPTKVAVFTVVNALGAVVDRSGRVVRCNATSVGGDCGTVSELVERTLSARAPAQRTSGAPPEGLPGSVHATAEGNAGVAHTDADSVVDGPSESTTLTLVVTNQRLDFWALQRLAVQVHTSMARAIHPFQTERDGDVLYAVTTGEVENASLSPQDLGLLASEVAWDAVLASVPPLRTADTTRLRAHPSTLEILAGRYQLGPDLVLVVTREGDRLFAESAGPRPIYGFTAGQRSELWPTAAGDWFSRNVRNDRIRFDLDQAGRVIGLTLNPGSWELPGVRRNNQKLPETR